MNKTIGEKATCLNNFKVYIEVGSWYVSCDMHIIYYHVRDNIFSYSNFVRILRTLCIVFITGIYIIYMYSMVKTTRF